MEAAVYDICGSDLHVCAVLSGPGRAAVAREPRASPSRPASRHERSLT
jgi:hypothetical protein